MIQSAAPGIGDQLSTPDYAMFEAIESTIQVTLYLYDIYEIFPMLSLQHYRSKVPWFQTPWLLETCYYQPYWLYARNVFPIFMITMTSLNSDPKGWKSKPLSYFWYFSITPTAQDIRWYNELCYSKLGHHWFRNGLSPVRQKISLASARISLLLILLNTIANGTTGCGNIFQFNSSLPSVVYMRQWTGSGLVQVMAWRRTGLLAIGLPGTNFSEIRLGISLFSFNKMHLKVSSATMIDIFPGGDVVNLGCWNHFSFGEQNIDHTLSTVRHHIPF